MKNVCLWFFSQRVNYPNGEARSNYLYSNIKLCYTQGRKGVLQMKHRMEHDQHKTEDDFLETLIMMEMLDDLDDKQQYKPPRKKKKTNWIVILICVICILYCLSTMLKYL